jgi:hypothetical protein
VVDATAPHQRQDSFAAVGGTRRRRGGAHARLHRIGKLEASNETSPYVAVGQGADQLSFLVDDQGELCASSVDLQQRFAYAGVRRQQHLFPGVHFITLAGTPTSVPGPS